MDPQHMENCSIIIQKLFRGHQFFFFFFSLFFFFSFLLSSFFFTFPRCRKDFKKLKSVIVIQSFWRMIQVRLRYPQEVYIFILFSFFKK